MLNKYRGFANTAYRVARYAGGRLARKYGGALLRYAGNRAINYAANKAYRFASKRFGNKKSKLKHRYVAPKMYNVPSADAREIVHFNYRVGNKRPKICNGVHVLYNSSGGRITAQSGYQSMNAAVSLMDYTDLEAMFGVIPQEGTVAQRTGTKLVPLQQTLRFHMTNQQQAGVDITIFHVISRRDSAVDAAQTIITGLTNQWANPAAPYYLDIHPKNSQAFRELYVIKKTASRYLGPGATMDITVKCKPKCAINHQRILANGENKYAGITYQLVIIARGVPVNAQANVTDVTTAPVALDFVWTKHQRFTWISTTTEAGTATMGIDSNIANPYSVLLESGTLGVMSSA